ARPRAAGRGGRGPTRGHRIGPRGGQLGGGRRRAPGAHPGRRRGGRVVGGRAGDGQQPAARRHGPALGRGARRQQRGDGGGRRRRLRLRPGCGAHGAARRAGVDPRAGRERGRLGRHRHRARHRHRGGAALAGGCGGPVMTIGVPRALIVLLAAVFSGYHLVLAGYSLTFDYASERGPVLAGMLLYGLATGAALWSTRETRMPVWLASFALGTAVALPPLITTVLDP